MRFSIVAATVALMVTGVFAECDEAKNCIANAAQAFGCQDLKCACNNWAQIKPPADLCIGQKAPNQFECALRWAKAMCGFKVRAFAA